MIKRPTCLRDTNQHALKIFRVYNDTWNASTNILFWLEDIFNLRVLFIGLNYTFFVLYWWLFCVVLCDFCVRAILSGSTLFTTFFLWTSLQFILGVQKLFVSTNPTDPSFLADPRLFLVFVDDFRAKIWFSGRERYVSRSNLLFFSLHLYVFILHIIMCC